MSITNSRKARIDAYIEANKKSPIIAMALAFFFGPIGYLYTSILGGFIAILLTIALLHIPVMTIFFWIVLIIAAPFEVNSSNKKLRAKAELIAG